MTARAPETLGALVERTVARHPEAVALEVAEERLSYREMWEAAGRLAARLPAGVPVALHARRDPVTYLGYLAALRRGAAVVPLNPGFPLARSVAMIRAAGAGVVVGSDDEACRELAAAVDGCTPVVPASGETVSGTRNRRAPDPPVTPAGPDDLAYVLFTSGSTGTPKGVPIRHRNATDYVRFHAERYSSGPGSRFAQTFDLTFDPSVFELFVAWSGGATLVVPTRSELADPADFVNRRRITHWFSVPSVITLARRMRRLPPGCMPDLRWSLFAGEQLTWGQADAWGRAAPGSVVDNLYGPTELTVTCTGYRVPAAPQARPATPNGTVPIGEPHPGVEYVLLDEDGRPGDRGELCARGPQRFGGYLRSSDDAGRFVGLAEGRAREGGASGPPAAELYYRTGDLVSRESGGMLVHRGRLDTQIKVHGYRVELGEIEAVVREQPHVEDAAVVVQAGTEDLVGYYVGREADDDRALDAALRARLPWYMTLTRLRRVEHLPVTANGKVDRRRLADQGAAGPAPSVT